MSIEALGSQMLTPEHKDSYLNNNSGNDLSFWLGTVATSPYNPDLAPSCLAPQKMSVSIKIFNRWSSEEHCELKTLSKKFYT